MTWFWRLLLLAFGDDFRRRHGEEVLAAIAAEAEWLAKGDDARFMNDIALRLQDEE